MIHIVKEQYPNKNKEVVYNWRYLNGEYPEEGSNTDIDMADVKNMLNSLDKIDMMDIDDMVDNDSLIEIFGTKENEDYTNNECDNAFVSLIGKSVIGTSKSPDFESTFNSNKNKLNPTKRSPWPNGRNIQERCHINTNNLKYQHNKDRDKTNYKSQTDNDIIDLANTLVKLKLMSLPNKLKPIISSNKKKIKKNQCSIQKKRYNIAKRSQYVKIYEKYTLRSKPIFGIMNKYTNPILPLNWHIGLQKI